MTLTFFKGFSTGLVPLTREAIVPYLMAVSLPARTSTHVQHSCILYSSHIPQALRFYFTYECIWSTNLNNQILSFHTAFFFLLRTNLIDYDY